MKRDLAIKYKAMSLNVIKAYNFLSIILDYVFKLINLNMNVLFTQMSLIEN